MLQRILKLMVQEFLNSRKGFLSSILPVLPCSFIYRQENKKMCHTSMCVCVFCYGCSQTFIDIQNYRQSIQGHSKSKSYVKRGRGWTKWDRGELSRKNDITQNFCVPFFLPLNFFSRFSRASDDILVCAQVKTVISNILYLLVYNAMSFSSYMYIIKIF